MAQSIVDLARDAGELLGGCDFLMQTHQFLVPVLAVQTDPA